ncbi:diaminopimelate aminotransferase [Methanofervidicoccus sp. A16]|uniref:M20 family metallo-hydrolase n=1 Tax=Methanofervidicoccus sp. A16 TaxID=2607662 RepID=UPI0011889A1C|nr:M20 family metallo-hydrolase [Methanofervidicoccus sp. A16]AXI25119.1 diaminopimelate aminotransferase [Methanofervidicoccus sp. A16]
MNKDIVKETIEIASDLIRIKSVNPAFGGTGEKEKGEYILNKLKEYIERYKIKNCRIVNYDVVDEKGIVRPNIVAKFDFNRGRTLHIISHIDTVPEGELSLWESPPYEPRIKEGKIYGRGSEDNHKGIVSSLILLKMIFESEEFNPKYNLSLIFLSDEECGSRYGIQHLLKYEEEVFNKDDLIIVPDFGTPEGNYIEIAEKGILWIRFKIKGKQCHGSTPNDGINANVLSANFIRDLYNKLYSKYNREDPLFSPPYSTFEPTMIINNVENVNTIPGYIEFTFDCRILPDYKLEEVLRDIEEFIEDFKKNLDRYLIHYDREALDEVSIDYEILQRGEPSKTPEDSEIVQEIGKAIKKVLNKEPILCGMGGGTIGAFLRYKNYDTVVWGIGEETAHQPNEHIKIEDLINMAKVYYEVLNDE